MIINAFIPSPFSSEPQIKGSLFSEFFLHAVFKKLRHDACYQKIRLFVEMKPKSFPSRFFSANDRDFYTTDRLSFVELLKTTSYHRKRNGGNGIAPTVSVSDSRDVYFSEEWDALEHRITKGLLVSAEFGEPFISYSEWILDGNVGAGYLRNHLADLAKKVFERIGFTCEISKVVREGFCWTTHEPFSDVRIFLIVSFPRRGNGDNDDADGEYRKSRVRLAESTESKEMEEEEGKEKVTPPAAAVGASIETHGTPNTPKLGRKFFCNACGQSMFIGAKVYHVQGPHKESCSICSECVLSQHFRAWPLKGETLL
jgi:hypothetical protein